MSHSGHWKLAMNAGRRHVYDVCEGIKGRRLDVKPTLNHLQAQEIEFFALVHGAIFPRPEFVRTPKMFGPCAYLVTALE